MLEFPWLVDIKLSVLSLFYDGGKCETNIIKGDENRIHENQWNESKEDKKIQVKEFCMHVKSKAKSTNYFSLLFVMSKNLFHVR